MGIEIPNEKIYNTFMDDGEYETGKKTWKKEQIEKVQMSALLQKALQSANQQADPANQTAQALMEKLRGTTNEGRPATNAQPPRLQQKMRDGIPDSTIASY
jgi:hypothetical protein